MWHPQTERPSPRKWVAMVLLAPLVPVLAAAIQSALIVLVGGTHLYQAMLYPYEPAFDYFNTALYYVLGMQMLITTVLLWPLIRFPVVHRVTALVVFGACLYYDLFEVTRVVMR